MTMHNRNTRIGTALTAVLLATALIPGLVRAEDYVIDTKGAHAFVQFRIQHLGYSWLYGRFNDFSGTFSYDEKDPGASKVDVVIKTASVDSNHAERDKHLRGSDFLDADKYPEARFKGISYKPTGAGKATLSGELTLRGVTKVVSLDVTEIGHGRDPWGGYRRGFEGTTKLKLKDYGIPKDLGPASAEVAMTLSVEGIRQVEGIRP
jgi:polyisoprenoid-binding protein YceI